MSAESIDDRFWSKVDRDGPPPAHVPELGSCWLWTASKRGGGYGQFNVRQENGQYLPKLAHRVAWEIEHGPVPDGLLVCHRCDVKACVRLDHLFLGTHADNSADCVAKGRNYGPVALLEWQRQHPDLRSRGDAHGELVRAALQAHPERVRRGEHHGRARLSDHDIEDIRDLHARGALTVSDIEHFYGIGRRQAGRILRGEQRVDRVPHPTL